MDYILRDVPDEIWRKVKARAALEGMTIRGVIVALLKEYAAGRPKKGGKS
jgi:hypothetical protein